MQNFMRLKNTLPFAAIGLMAVAVLLLLTLGDLRVVVSDSMAPAYRAGDLLWIRPAGEPVSPGMVVSFMMEEKLVTHRVVRIEGEALVTRGDNNDREDDWRVPLSAVTGVPALRVPYLGYLLFFIKQPLGWALFILLPAGWIVFQEARKISAALRKPEKA